MRATLLLVAVACSSHPKAQPTSPIPAGFVATSAESLPPGSRVYVEARRANVEHAFLGSLSVQPLPAKQLELTASFCTDAGAAFAKQTGNTVDAAELIAGPACRIRSHANDRPIAVTQTVFHDAAGWWSATCMADPRDDVARKACDTLPR